MFMLEAEDYSMQLQEELEKFRKATAEPVWSLKVISFVYQGRVTQNLPLMVPFMVTLPSMVTTMEILILIGCWALTVTMVVAIDGKVTINSKFYATGPRKRVGSF